MSRFRLLALFTCLALLAGLPGLAQEAQLPGGQFFDDNDSPHEGNIEAISAEGITSGCVAGGAAFCPNAHVTRAQMATFLTRALGLTPLSNAFGDVNPQNPHAGNIAAIKAAGVTVGCNSGGTAFCPNDRVTRAQMASFIVRAFDLTPKANGPFTDVTGVHRQDINAMAAEGITLGCGGTRYCPTNPVARAHMATFLARAMDLEPVELAPQPKLAGVQPVCGACSGPSGSSDGDFYVQEGWFYNLPYGSGDQARFASADFRLFLDGNEVTNLVQVPMTNLDGTVISLEGYLFSDLDLGNHEMVGEWWWDDQSTFTASVEFTVSG